MLDEPPVTAASDSPSLTILGTLVGVALLVGVLAAAGVVRPVVRWALDAFKAMIAGGFRTWERTLGWMPWPLFAVFVAGLVVCGVWADERQPALTAVISAALLYSGVISCLAYIHLDFERVEVERGYKALANPEQGQQLAQEYIRHGHRARWPLLVAAALAFVAGFTLLNKLLWLGPGREWYDLRGLPGTVADFAAYSIVSLYNAVDVLDMAERMRVFQLPHVVAVKWPARVLLVVYKLFFALVLVQQILSAFRRSGQLGQLITDFWSPNAPIHQRARTALPLFGTSAADPLMRSLREAAKVTREMREELPEVLASAGPAAIPFLTKYLHDPSENVRIVAAAALGRLGGRRSLRRLIHLASDPSDAVRLAAVDAIGRIASPRLRDGHAGLSGLAAWFWAWFDSRAGALSRALSALALACRDRSGAVRTRALTALAEIGPAAAAVMPAIREALRDEDEDVERAAVEALVHVAGASALPDLIALCGDGTVAVRQAAVRGVGMLGAQDGAEAAARLVLDRDDGVVREAASALGRIGTLPPAAVAVLEAGIKDGDNVIRARTARALGELGPAAKPLAPALARLLDDRNDAVRAEAVTALGRIGEPVPEAMAKLTRALDDDDNWVTALAAEALGKMGGHGPSSAAALARALRHPTPVVRANAAEALGRLGHAAAPALPALVEACADADAAVREAAVRALGRARRPTPPVLGALRKAVAADEAVVRAAAVAALREMGQLGEEECLALLRDGSDAVQLEVLDALPRLDPPGAVVLEEACRCLRDDHNPEVRIKAASVLGEAGVASEGVCASLLEASRTAEVPVRVEALRSLAELGCPSAPEAFADGLKDTSAEVRRAAALGWTKADTVDAAALVPALQDADAVVRSTAAFALGRGELPDDAVPPLLACLHDEEDRVRFHAVVALRTRDDAEVLEAMRKCLADESARVRLAAARALLRHDEADEAARKLADEALASADEATARMARQVLGRDGITPAPAGAAGPPPSPPSAPPPPRGSVGPSPA